MVVKEAPSLGESKLISGEQGMKYDWLPLEICYYQVEN